MIKSLTKNNVKYLEMLIAASLIALSLAAPIIVHHLGLKGTEYLPIFFTLSLGAYILNPIYLVAVALASPLINSIITNMPQIPTLYFLMFEGAIFSILISFGKNKLSFYILAPLSFILARLSSVLLALIFKVDIESWFNGIINGYRGIIVNSIFAIAAYIICKKRF